MFSASSLLYFHRLHIAKWLSIGEYNYVARKKMGSAMRCLQWLQRGRHMKTLKRLPVGRWERRSHWWLYRNIYTYEEYNFYWQQTGLKNLASNAIQARKYISLNNLNEKSSPNKKTIEGLLHWANFPWIPNHKIVDFCLRWHSTIVHFQKYGCRPCSHPSFHSKCRCFGSRYTQSTQTTGKQKNVQWLSRRKECSEELQMMQELRLGDEEGYRQWMSQQTNFTNFLHKIHAWDLTKFACPIIFQLKWPRRSWSRQQHSQLCEWKDRKI